jgi:hypothetical protein
MVAWKVGIAAATAKIRADSHGACFQLVSSHVCMRCSAMCWLL